MIELESVLSTQELHRRPSRAPNFEAESRALGELADALADSPRSILQRLVEVALKLCRAGSAGVSLLTQDDGGKNFYWPAIAGAWRPHVGGGTPRDFGPCGVVLDRNSAQLFSHPERFYPYLATVSPPIVEALLIPFYVEGHAVGTVWVISHEENRRFDGEDMRLLVSLGKFASNAQQVLASIDALERDQAALRESERRLHDIMDALPAAVYTTDSQGLLTHFNPAAVVLSGRVPELGSDRWCVAWKLYREDGTPLPLDECPMALALKEGHVAGVTEIIAERPDGQRAWVLPHPTPLRDADGKIVGGINMVLDISARKEAEAKLRESEAEARRLLELNQTTMANLGEADRRKSEFLAMLAHELRNPLAPIRNAVNVLCQSGSDDKEVRSLTEMLHRQVGQMARLVDDLLDVSRISRGKIDIHRERVELASVVCHAVEAVRQAYDSMRHELTVTLPREPIYLDADPTRMAQIVGNLLNNACKFTAHGGRIRITAGREGANAVIRVGDNGIGIARDQVLQIFNMFMQIDTSLERSQSGLGIGLTLVKNLVEMHGGFIEATSPGLGQGSEFIITLPVAAGPAPTASSKTSGVEPATVQRRVLVVDDNQDAAQSLAMLLKLSGHDAHLAHDGLEAVETAAKLRFDVILLDIGLPTLNGYEAARRIRQEQRECPLLVALTGWGQEEDRRRSQEAGFDAHMVKPVDLARLAKVLSELDGGP